MKLKLILELKMRIEFGNGIGDEMGLGFNILTDLGFNILMGISSITFWVLTNVFLYDIVSTTVNRDCI